MIKPLGSTLDDLYFGFFEKDNNFWILSSWKRKKNRFFRQTKWDLFQLNLSTWIESWKLLKLINLPDPASL